MPLVPEDDLRPRPPQQEGGVTPAKDIIGGMVTGEFGATKEILAWYGVPTVAIFARWCIAAWRNGWSFEMLEQKIQEAGGGSPDPSLWD